MLALQGKAQLTNISTNDMMRLLNEVTNLAVQQQSIINNPQMVDYDRPNLSERCYTELLGVIKVHFDHLLSTCKRNMRSTDNRSVTNALAMFLMMLRMNQSQYKIAALFNTEQQRVSDAIDRVSKLLDENFVPLHLGFNHISVQQMVESHSTKMSNILTENQSNHPVVILDGTYFYIQKSSNFDLQKATFSMQKHRNLVKAMLVCCPDGYILHVDGTYKSDGSNNDANILNSMLRDPDGIKKYLSENGISIVDRG